MNLRRPGRFAEEAGVALGLAIMVVVVAGVMGAGLLVFVRGDLEAVVKTNQGQRAFQNADAGVQLAKRHLLGDASPALYDEDGSATRACDSPADAANSQTSDWSAAKGGVARDFAGGGMEVSIRWLGSGCGAPGPATGAGYFEITSTGTYRDAKRRVRAVYLAATDFGAPLANFASGNVNLAGTARVSGGSVFAGKDVNASGARVSGADQAYGDWKTKFNANARPNSRSAAAAVGRVFGLSGATPRYDSASSPKFVAGGADSGELTFPFDAGYWKKPSRQEFLKEEAKEQGNYRDAGGNLSWPEGSTDGTVVYVKGGGSPVRVDGSTCGEVAGCRGTLVVEGGRVAFESGRFTGAIVTVPGEPADSSSDLSISVGEGATLDGFANSGGDLAVAGALNAPEAGAAAARPGFHEMKLWSWRELYE